MNKIYKVAAFPNKNCGGNPAGVVLNADKYSDCEMLNIAKNIGYSETAFVSESDIADFKVRFFTPVEEVDLCGHATIATFNLLRDLGHIDIGSYTQETKAGLLKIEVYKETVFMEQNNPIFYEVIDKREVLDCFDINHDCCNDRLPIHIVSTGLKDIILPIKDLETLNNLKPNSQLITQLSRKYDAVGIHAFCLETTDGGEAHTRNFAPLYGIEEESATGTASGALASYLAKYMSERFSGFFEFEQGYFMNSPSKIIVNLKSDNNTISEVWVGGRASLL